MQSINMECIVGSIAWFLAVGGRWIVRGLRDSPPSLARGYQVPFPLEIKCAQIELPFVP